MAKVANVLLFVTASPDGNITKRTFNVSVGGVSAAPVDVGPEVTEVTVQVPASTAFTFSTTVTNPNGEATSETYSATLGDLESHPDTGLGHQVVSISDV